MKLKLFVVASVMHLLDAKRSKPSVTDFVEGSPIHQRLSMRHGISPESIEANILDWWPRWNDPEEPAEVDPDAPAEVDPEAPTDDVIENDDWESDEDEKVEFRPEE